jgi:hypothetical protein
VAQHPSNFWTFTMANISTVAGRIANSNGLTRAEPTP